MMPLKFKSTEVAPVGELRLPHCHGDREQGDAAGQRREGAVFSAAAPLLLHASQSSEFNLFISTHVL
jgi:hypothetical protein